ncbi:MAG: dTDP-4-amino-4,6-dideoxygalactose transaminase [Planctomycetota bacterium]|nr:dTDP-4-amino-4,6-dideoxygalactose transaminase [Planctomycetota bacterium]
MESISIPFNRPMCFGKEREYAEAVLASGHYAGDGPFTKRCHSWLEQLLGSHRVLLTTSCTHALEMSAMLLNVAPGDEVILPSFTFVSTANAFVLRGAKPVFVDIRPDTLNMDERGLERSITNRTKAIVPVHYGGVGCEMDAIAACARAHGLPIVEDNAHGLFGTYKGRPLGSLGAMATLSFHESKNIVCGEGGALAINDPALAERAEVLREKGTNRSRFFRGQVDKYSWIDIGSSFLPSDILAAILLAQLENAEFVQERRKRVWKTYFAGLADWSASHGVRLPCVPEDREPAWHLFYLLMPSLEARQAFLAHLRAAGILATFHYLPLHLSDMGRTFGGQPGDCPITEDICDRLARLPLFPGLQDAEVERVLERVLSFQP